MADRDRQDERPLTAISQALDEMAWGWLEANYSKLAEAVKAEVEGGASPEEIRKSVMTHARMIELADKCWQAARWLWSQKGSQS